jgi:hypothetical protein
MPQEQPRRYKPAPKKPQMRIQEVLVNRDPAPKVFTQADISGGFAANVTATLSYQNKGNESSEIKSIVVKSPPNVLVTISKTVQNQKQEVVPQVTVGDVDGLWDFKKASNKTLTVGRGEYIYIDAIHSYPGNVNIWVYVDKDQLLWVDQHVQM